MVALAQRIQDGNLKQHHLFDSVVGQLKTREKRWIVDIDVKDAVFAERLSEFINAIRPEGPKIETKIPTKNGYHLITKRFDVMEFKKHYLDIDIQRKNPTLLYFPNSIK